METSQCKLQPTIHQEKGKSTLHIVERHNGVCSLLFYNLKWAFKINIFFEIYEVLDIRDAYIMMINKYNIKMDIIY